MNKPNSNAYSHYFEDIGIAPGCSWHQLKKAYRIAVKQWHPDHFHNKPDLFAEAESKIIKINKAFQELTEYYRQYGQLPNTQSNQSNDATIQDTEQVAPEVPEQHPSNSHSNPDRHGGFHKRFIPSAQTTLILATMLSITYVITQTLMDDPVITLSAPIVKQPTISNLSRQNHYAEQKQSVKTGRSNQTFSYGSTLSEVHAVQGAPTAVGDDIWIFGKSKVHFRDGAVVRWEEHESNPLFVTNGSEAYKPKLRYFRVGSTMEEVRAVQGRPLNATDAVWQYRLSEIFFQDGRVTGWNQSPLDPLKARN